METILNNEGVMLAVCKYISKTGSQLRAEGLANNITNYLCKHQSDAKQEYIVIQKALRQIETGKTQSLSTCIARDWLHSLGFN